MAGPFTCLTPTLMTAFADNESGVVLLSNPFLVLLYGTDV
jgi:hypothetical protein